MTQTEARQWLEAEIDRLERAPSLNGCSMTEEWQQQLDVFRLCKAALDGSAIDAKYDAAYQNGYKAGIKVDYEKFWRKRCEKLEAELDSAVAVLAEKQACSTCKHYTKTATEEPCASCDSEWFVEKGCKWEWRGVEHE